MDWDKIEGETIFYNIFTSYFYKLDSLPKVTSLQQVGGGKALYGSIQWREKEKFRCAKTLHTHTLSKQESITFGCTMKVKGC